MGGEEEMREDSLGDACVNDEDEASVGLKHLMLVD
jgi:hypothetical protein